MKNRSAAILCMIVSLAGVCAAQTGRAREFDEFSGFTCEDLKARLDNFAIALLHERDVRGFVVVYGGKRGPRGEAQEWIGRAKDYLFNSRNLNSERVAMLNGGYREARAAELWLLPGGATPPAATPAVRPEDVRLKKGSARKSVARMCAQ